MEIQYWGTRVILSKKSYRNGKVVYDFHTNSQIDLQKFFGELSDESHEPAICKTFGCGKHLTLEERRCGDRCLDHLGIKKVDVMRVIKFL